MRFSSLLTAAVLITLLVIAAGCTSSAPKSGAVMTPAETTAQPASATTAAPVATTAKCPAGQTACADGTCRDFATDHDACGGCGNVCPAGYICKAANCVNPAGTVAATAVVTQAVPEQTTSTQNPVTSVITTSTTTGGSGLSGIIQRTAVATTYPPNVQTIDCSKHPMSITSISPSSGPKAGGTPIVIHGTGFKRGSYISTNVKFGTSSNIGLPGGATSDTEIVINTPKSSTTGTVDVRFAAAFNGVSNQCMTPVTAATKFTYT